MKIKGLLKDLTGASRVKKKRKQAYDAASGEDKAYDPINDVAKKLHPGKINLEVISIKSASKSAKTITFTSEHLPFFKAGQYLTLQLQIGNSIVTRAYSICSSKKDTRKDKPTVSITVKKLLKDAFVSDFLLNELKVGDVLLGEVGLGQFYYEPIRDSKNVIAIAGGSGITPFVSMAKDIIDYHKDYNLTILYGSVDEDDIVLKEELDNLNNPHIKVINVLSGDNPSWNGEKGFISKEIISKYMGEDPTFFICGPKAMQDFVLEALKELQILERRIRVEAFSSRFDLSTLEGYPKDAIGKEFKITVKQGIYEQEIPAKSEESILVALERAGYVIHSACRSGACGFCRIKVISGTYFVAASEDGRRAMDKKYNYVHSCSTYPTSDIIIKININ